MAEPTHAYSPDQYATVVGLWRRVLDCAGDTSFDDDDLYVAILSDGDTGWWWDERHVRLCYSSDHSGHSYDRANARTLASEFPDLVHTDNNGPWSESYVEVLIGELPSNDIEAGIEELTRLVGTLESLSDYPILDESELSDLEQQIEQEAWDAWFTSDLRSEVAVNLGCDEYEIEEDFQVSDEQLQEMFYELSYDGSSNTFEVESATSGYFVEWEDIAAKMADHIVSEWRKPAVHPNQVILQLT